MEVPVESPSTSKAPLVRESMESKQELEAAMASSMGMATRMATTFSVIKGIICTVPF